MDSGTTFPSYLDKFTDILSISECTDGQGGYVPRERWQNSVCAILSYVSERKGTIYVVGNGGSSAIASHVCNDFCNTAGIKATALNEPSILTCFSNDYGYENVYSAYIERFASDEDLLIAISSSGQSENILNAVFEMKKINGKIITLSGFESKNPLRSRGDINLWLDSSSFGFVEVGHMLLLHYLADIYSLKKDANVK